MIFISFSPDINSKNLHSLKIRFADLDHPAACSLSFYTFYRINTFAL
jgi:hypothetical protein